MLQNDSRKVKEGDTFIALKGINGDDTLEINFIESNNITKFYVIDGEKFDVNQSGVWVDSDYAKNNNIQFLTLLLYKFYT